MSAFLERQGVAQGGVFIVELDNIQVPNTLADLKQYRFWFKDQGGRARRMADPMPRADEIEDTDRRPSALPAPYPINVYRSPSSVSTPSAHPGRFRNLMRYLEGGMIV